MPINASPEYYKAYSEYLAAQTIYEKIERLKKALVLAPKHKSSENLIAQIKGKLARLKKELEVEKKKKKGHSVGIKKSGHAQAVILGSENAGKSSLLSVLTNAKPKISEIPFTTIKPEIGTLDLNGIRVQLVELPIKADSEMFSIVHGANLIILIVTSISELTYWANLLKEREIKIKRIFVLNKIDSISENELKKFQNLDILRISCLTGDGKGINELKEKISESIGLMRVYTKEPGRKQTSEPIIMEKNSTIKDVAKKIREDYVRRFIKARVWGKSAKFPGQIVGIEHVLGDNDLVELYLK